MNPPDLRYSKEHEWVRIESEGVAVVGITAFAVEQLGDVVFLDLPEIGAELSQFAKLGEVESVKAVSDLFSPLTGTVLERNEAAINRPETPNDDAYGQGWLLKAAVKDTSQLDNLLTAQQYEEFLASQH